MNNWKNAFGKVLKKNFFTTTEVQNIKDMVFSITNEEDRKDYIWKFYEQDKTTVIESNTL